MEIKKTQQADMEQRRATGFLLGLIFVLAVFYVALEWNSAEATTDIDPIDLTDLMHESELVPMSNEDIIALIDAPPDKINALAGKLGRIEGVTAKAVYSNVITNN